MLLNNDILNFFKSLYSKESKVMTETYKRKVDIFEFVEGKDY